jgi:predicted membrane-bound spermidine synthase
MSTRISLPAWHLYLISFVEGGALMAVELMGAKLITPFYGNSIYVWASVLGFTLGGLVIGYFVGGRLSTRAPSRSVLYRLMLASAALVALMPFLAPAILSMTSGMEFRPAILVSAFLILLPPIVIFGMVSPMVIRLLTARLEEVGKSAGRIYAISTLGGIVLNFSMGLLLIPYVGLRISALLTAGLLAIFPLIFMLRGQTGKIPAKETQL